MRTWEYNRLLCFFVLNKSATVCNVYHYPLRKRWMRITRLALKLAFIIIAVGLVFYNSIEWRNSVKEKTVTGPFEKDVYSVRSFSIKNDTSAIAVSDQLRWQDLIIDNGEMGSIKTSDTSFRQRYNRGYFFYKADTAKRTIEMKKLMNSQTPIASFSYERTADNNFLLKGKQGNDSLFIVLTKTNRHFQLAEKQFHWLSEYNW